MKFLIKTIQFLGALFIMVGIHELGHLFFAKLFKMRVYTYIIGFPPKIFKWKWGETEYSLGSIPLGGAVQIAGMVDESLNNDYLNHPPEPWEFRAKETWKRLITILGGIIFNLVSGIFICVALAYVMGYTFLPKDEVNKYGIFPNTIGSAVGFQIGDKIIKINGANFEDFQDVFSIKLLLGSNNYYTIYRDGKIVTLPIPGKIIEDLSDIKKSLFIRPLIPCLIQDLPVQSNATKAGLKPGDQIIALNGSSTLDREFLMRATQVCVGETVEVVYLRDGIKASSQIQVEREGLGITFKTLPYNFKQLDYSFAKSIFVGLGKATELMQGQALTIWKLITGKLSVKKTLSGPIGIAQSFDDEFIGYKFWTLVAYLSITIALANLLPIPALDGGYALCILYEAISGRKLSDNFMQTIQKAGMIFIILLTLYAFNNDIRKLM